MTPASPRQPVTGSRTSNATTEPPPSNHPPAADGRTASAQQIRHALEQTAAALAHARLDDLLAAGEALEMALAQLPRAPLTTGADADRLRAEVEAARTALRRCRRLGVSLGDFVRATFDAHGVATDYDPSRQAAAELTGRQLDTSG